MYRIAFFTEKGGAGKTTFSANVSSILAQRGLRILLVDMDPQGHSAKVLGATQSVKKTILEALISRRRNIKEFIRLTRIGNLSILPADWSLADFTVNVANDPSRHRRLQYILDGVREDYDFIFIDTPPSLELITLNILLASDFVIIPAALTYLGLVGVASSLSVLKNLKSAFGYAPSIFLVVPNFYEDNASCNELLETLKTKLGSLVSSTLIHRDPEIDRAQSYSLTVIELSPQSQGAMDFQNLCDEITLKIP